MNKKKHHLMKKICLVAVAAVFLCACQEKRLQPGEIVARVGDEYLTRDMVLLLLPEGLGGEEREFFIKRLVENWIETRTLAQKARNEGFELSEQDRWNIQNIESEILVTKFLEVNIDADNPVTDRAIEAYYNANQEEFIRASEEVHLVHLFFEKVDKAIAEEIRQSQSLLDVIKNNYLDLQINRVIEPNDDLGYVPVEQLRPEFQRAIKFLSTGAIKGPIKTGDGVHYLQLIDRQPAGSLRKLSLVKDEIEQYLQVTERHRKTKLLKEKIRKEFEVETFYNNIL
jgi:parvulin-like peptidyl-prolyl isomerase